MVEGDPLGAGPGTAPTVVVSGRGMLESVRTALGRVWFSDWTAGRIESVDPATGAGTIVAHDASFPLCFDVTERGEVVILSGRAQAVLRVGGDRSDAVADLRGLALGAWNEIVVHPSGRMYVNCANFDPAHGFPEPGTATGFVAVVEPDGGVRVRAGDLAFPNGMAITPDGATLIVAESHAQRLTAFAIGDGGALDARREWAATPGLSPDGIALDGEGRVWVADVGTGAVVLVEEGGHVARRIGVGQGAFSCALAADGATLYVATADWADGRALADPDHRWNGTLVAVDVRTP